MIVKINLASAVERGPDVQIEQTQGTVGSPVMIKVGDAVAYIDAGDLFEAAKKLKF